MKADQRDIALRAPSKHIGIIHFKTGDTDGVSLEIEKWARIFCDAGHKVFLCSGKHGRSEQNEKENIVDKSSSHPPQVTVIAELDYHSSEAMLLNRETFGQISSIRDEADYRKDLLEQADILRQKFEAWIDYCSLDIVIPQNIWSVAVHPAAAIGLAQAIENKGMQVLAQHHDFYWERVDGIRLSCSTAVDFADTYLPPHKKDYSHVVINSLAKNTLEKRKGISAVVIPNVFDFSGPNWEIDAWNSDFRTAFGLQAADIIMLQATRVVPRKGIELAIDVVEAMNKRKSSLVGQRLSNGEIFTKDNRIALVLAGYAQDDTSGTYLKRLRTKAETAHIDMIHIGDRVASTRGMQNNQKVYSLWDAYVHADVVTYPSYWEGWGNQLLEAVKARLPVVLFEYPVYRADIVPVGFSMISLGGSIASWSSEKLAQIEPYRIEAAVEEVLEILVDRQKRENMVELNYRIAQSKFSLEALESYLKPLMLGWS